MKSRKTKKIKSFTLAEVILYVALASIIIFTVSYLLSTIVQVRTKNKVILEVEGQGNALMQTLTQAVRSAQDVTSPAPGGSSSTTLNLLEDSEIKNPTIIGPENKVVNIKEGQGAPIALTSQSVEVKDLTFKNLSTTAGVPGAIKVQFTIKFANQDSARYELNYEKTFYGAADLRNSP